MFDVKELFKPNDEIVEREDKYAQVISKFVLSTQTLPNAQMMALSLPVKQFDIIRHKDLDESVETIRAAAADFSELICKVLSEAASIVVLSGKATAFDLQLNVAFQAMLIGKFINTVTDAIVHDELSVGIRMMIVKFKPEVAPHTTNILMDLCIIGSFQDFMDESQWRKVECINNFPFSVTVGRKTIK